MKFKFVLVALLFSFLFISCASQNKSRNTAAETLTAPDLKPYGRYVYNAKHQLELISSAVHFTIKFTGNSCIIYASIKDPNGHNYMQYELDGVYQKRIKVIGGTTQSLTINATTNTQHTLTMYKATEAHTGGIVIEQITGNNLHAVAPDNSPLIEFIGNSITCGAMADTSEVKCGNGDYQDQHNAYYAYGPRVARALHANYLVSAVSGIGIYRTWNMDAPSMPQVYEKADFQLNDTAMWNFKTYTPRIVSIALGTNDMSHGDGVHARKAFDSALFVHNYIAFVKLVKQKYPQATIALLSSPMMHGNDREVLQHCLTVIKQNIDAVYPTNKPIALHFFTPMQAGGCGGHPSVEDHAKIAEELVPFFKGLL